MQIKKIIILSLALILVGAGCSDTPEEPTKVVVQPIKKEIVKKPESSPPIEKAYQFCKSQGYNIVMHYDTIAKKNVISCVFSNNTQCEAVHYLKGMCGPDAGARIATGPIDNNLTALRYCDRTSPPVCGADGHNYSNHCVAAQQNVKILHEGLCTESEQANPLTTQSPTAAIPNTSNNGSVVPQNEQQTKEPAPWLSTLFDLIQSQQPLNPRTFVERCNYAGETYYHYVEGCKNCFSILYNYDSTIACFPNNDINISCPGNFKGNCTRIWRDNR